MASFILLRRPDVLNRTGLCKTAIYDRIQQGSFPPPISLGGRSVAWAEHEIDAVIRAFVAGKTEDEMKLLVSDLIAQRTEVNE